nr:7TM diverse intracellular signaling domain-containing protein [uncultured Arsenicibacter sp.]
MSGYFTYTAVRQTLDGMLIMMACYALFSFLTHRQRIYLLYTGYILCILLRFALRDYARQNPGQQALLHLFEDTFEAVAVCTYNQFAIRLMAIPRHDPPGYRMLRIMTLNLIVTACLEWIFYAFRLPEAAGTALFVVSRLQLVAGTVYIVPRLLRRRHPTLTYFITGTAFFVAGSFTALILARITPQPAAIPPLIFMQFGVVIEVLFFTMGISAQHRLDEQEKLNAQAALIEQLQENERKQQKINHIRDDIARDLHDMVGSDLSTIAMLTAAISTQTAPSRDMLRLVEQTARRVVDTMREIVWNLNISNQTPENIAFRFREIAYEFFNTETTGITLEIDPVLASELPPEVRKEILLIYKESLENIRKHAGASQVVVRLTEPLNNVLQLSIQDNGTGFTPETLSRQSGLQNMHQRAHRLGGKLTILARSGEGVSIQLQCPIQLTVPA